MPEIALSLVVFRDEQHLSFPLKFKMVAEIRKSQNFSEVIE